MEDDFNDNDKVESNLWDYKSNPEIIGVIVRREEGLYGQQLVINDGEKDFVIPSLVVLETKLKTVEEGDKVKIVCLGETEPEGKGKKPYYNFDVYIKKKN